MAARFISERIRPVPGTFDAARMATGEPGLPRQFVWRGHTVTVTAVVRAWREAGPCHHGSLEQYVRKHWYEVDTAADGRMQLYFERQPRRGSRRTWWLFSVEPG